jgi:Glyoxalase/Bleomycin resistance protein/Dioxygenase superfamily
VPVLNFGQPPNGVIQLGFVVDDVYEAMREYSELLNVGPWVVYEHMSLSNIEYRGQPATLDLTIGSASAGHLQIELVQQNDEVPSVYTEAPADRRYGFHHWGVGTDDFDRDFQRLKDRGYEVAVYAYVEDFDARAAYMDTTKDLPGMVELIEMTPAVEQMFTDSYKASLGWDGTDPVRVAAAQQ